MTSLEPDLKWQLQKWNTTLVVIVRRMRDATATVPRDPRSPLFGTRREPPAPLFLGASMATLLALAPSCGSPDKTDDPPSLTAYEHAQACAAQLGPVPAFDLAAAVAIPVHQNGVPVEDGEVQECDLPAAFQAPCEQGLLGRLQGTRPDGTEDPDVVWLYIVRSGGFAAIGYHAVSGATCFLEIDTLPDEPILAAPSTVSAEAYNAQWASPRDMFEVSRCQDCHMADPFLHSPYLDQLPDPDSPAQPLVPVVAGASNPRPPYEIISAPDGPYTTELPGNSCTSCHRPQCTTLFDSLDGRYALDELAMPAPFHDLSTWDDAASTADREAVREWCKTLEPFGPQYDAGGDDEYEDEDDVEDGPCDTAYACAFECDAQDHDCARACGVTHLEAASASAFAALVNCGEAAGCGAAALDCLESACGVELDAFIATCE